ncbi:hypothetical protein GWK47_035325 [Chionoecetes opilio]|uniref:Uncharacterized protein n=1 Tax=Chionoecetes opilio TaxID=41210 RepID=A0A8J4YNB2_CHIOP|nr:hypothetical protein GWK47_035325 [Chionoecetes opilio]
MVTPFSRCTSHHTIVLTSRACLHSSPLDGSHPDHLRMSSGSVAHFSHSSPHPPNLRTASVPISTSQLHRTSPSVYTHRSPHHPTTHAHHLFFQASTPPLTPLRHSALSDLPTSSHIHIKPDEETHAKPRRHSFQNNFQEWWRHATTPGASPVASQYLIHAPLNIPVWRHCRVDTHSMVLDTIQAAFPAPPALTDGSATALSLHPFCRHRQPRRFSAILPGHTRHGPTLSSMTSIR